MSVSLSNLRYPEREIVLPRCLHHLKELCVASCSNCFSSLYDVWFKRKSLWKFFASYEPNSHARTVTLLVTLHRMNLAHYFRQLLAESRAYTVTLPVTLDRMNLAHYKEAFGAFSKGMR